MKTRIVVSMSMAALAVIYSVSAVAQEPVEPYSTWQANVTVTCNGVSTTYPGIGQTCNEAKSDGVQQANNHDCGMARRSISIPFSCSYIGGFTETAQSSSLCYPWVIEMHLCLCDGSGTELHIEAAGCTWCAAVQEAKNIARLLVGDCFCGCHYTYCFTIVKQPCVTPHSSCKPHGVSPRKSCRPRMIFRRRCR